MNECDVCGPHHGEHYTGELVTRTGRFTYHLCEEHYLAS